MMRKIILCFTALLLMFATCEKIPKDVKPIDWENYNDVYTVYWNLYSSCEKIKSEYYGKTIKIAGWNIWYLDAFSLCDDTKDNAAPFVAIECNLPEFKTKLDTSDLTKKCFIKGNIHLKKEKMPRGCRVFPVVKVTDINDIYFE